MVLFGVFLSSPCGNVPSRGILDLSGLFFRVSLLEVVPATLLGQMGTGFPSQRIVFCREVHFTVKYPMCSTPASLTLQSLQETQSRTICSEEPPVYLQAKLGGVSKPLVVQISDLPA